MHSRMGCEKLRLFLFLNWLFLLNIYIYIYIYMFGLLLAASIIIHNIEQEKSILGDIIDTRKFAPINRRRRLCVHFTSFLHEIRIPDNSWRTVSVQTTDIHQFFAVKSLHPPQRKEKGPKRFIFPAEL